MFVLISQCVLARATCRSPDVVAGRVHLYLIQFFCSILAHYFGELHLDTLIEFLYFLCEIYSVKAGIQRIWKLSLKPKILRELVFVNCSRFEIWYLEKGIFTSIERELHVSTPYEFLFIPNTSYSSLKLK